MALANFFDKSALAASQILTGYDRTAFEERLLTSPIEIAFDQNAVESNEGKNTLELSVRLLSRFYPEIILTALDTPAKRLLGPMGDIARSINPSIGLEATSPVATIAVGITPIERPRKVYFIGSDGWISHFSPHRPSGSANSSNPFGAGAAACFGAANVFRHVFSDQLKSAQDDSAFSLSLIDFEKQTTVNNTSPEDLGEQLIDLGQTVVVGLGAIGNGFVWALSKTPLIQGNIDLIDPEPIDLSNLQRYVLTAQGDVDVYKTEFAKKWLTSSRLNVTSHTGDWNSYLTSRGNWELETVVAAVDSAQARISLQGSLPKHILNAWTQASDLGISRHFNFLEDACLACIYPPRPGAKSESILISESFGLSEHEMLIREMLYNNSPLGQEWVEKIAEAKSVPAELLEPYIGKPIRDFYHTVFCGGVLLGQEPNRQVETPMTFQSALAGILLAAELIIFKGKFRQHPIETTTRIDLLRPLAQYLNDPIKKPTNGRCICQDEDFRERYSEKHASTAAK